MGGLVTPTGVLVPEASAPLTPEWFAARRKGITATDLPKILGLSNYGNALSVWNDKRTVREDSAGEAARWGNILEEPVAQQWAADSDTRVRPVGTLAHVNNPWMLASLDRIVTGPCPTNDPLMIGGCGLEVKTRSAYVAGKWKEDVPDDVLAQVQWGLMVTGLPHMHVACLIGGQKLSTYTVARDNELEAYLLSKAAPVWECVRTGVPPNVDADAAGVLVRELNAMFAKREGAVSVDPFTAEGYITSYREGHRLEKRGKALKQVAMGNMVKMLGGAEVATGEDDEPLWTYKRPAAKFELTADQRARLEQENPELHAELVAQGYITKNDPNPRFNLK